MPLVLPLVPGQRSTPEAVVVKEVRRCALVVVVVVVLAINVLTTKRCSQRMRRALVVQAKVRGVAKSFELVVVDNAHTGDPVASGVACRSSRRYQTG